MSSSRISRGGRPLPGSFNAEFTPGQMVMGICVFLLVAVLCFGAGVLVGRHEPKPMAADAAGAAGNGTTVASSNVPTTKSATAMAPPAPASTEAPILTPPAPRGVMPAPVSAPPGTPTHKAGTDAPRSVDLPPLPTTKSSNRPMDMPAQAPAEIPVQVDAQPVPEPTPPPTPAAAPPAPAPAPLPTTKSGANTKAGVPPTPSAAALPPLPTTKSAATKPATATPSDPEEALMGGDLLEPITAGTKKSAATTKTAANAATEKSATEKPAAEKPAAAPATGGGSFGLQVGAFPGPNREAQAAELKKRAEAAGLRAEIRPSKDKQYYRVVITGYGDRASALKALNDIKQRPGFEKAFVQDLSKL